MLRVGFCSGLELGVDVDKGMGPVLPHFGFPQMAKGWYAFFWKKDSTPVSKFSPFQGPVS